ncbi:SDR family NAD(P)-dependent oxidoreductase [Agrobacterium larrymoorei]|uniref:SDR family NAD(P)-dependent oxidoreductase n=1 Tax=Agrobacterium larrymoorei TaxID=160699 RepID=A0ABX8T933_9HYPH|nr:SDR family NAD(P)-dependent oxidoreductase [Agrobacterium larrymoorei]QYA08659.1 SDR family NAD(P)-dependent oxidoreductase [Agrobacterium larrymoorei]
MHVIITGGSSGIGLELARIYVRAGHHVSIIARNASRLDAATLELSTRTQKVFAIEGDVCDGEGIISAIRICERQAGHCNLLITSAGVVDPAMFEDMEPDSFRQQWDTNFVGTVNAVAAVYSDMKTRQEGAIMLVSSAAGHLGIPGYTAYCASKAAVSSFAESLRSEAGNSVYVGVCFPPDTLTPQLDQELKRRPALATQLIGKSDPWPADKVAGQIAIAVAKRRAQVHFGLRLRALAMIGAFIKPVLYWRLSRKV